MPHRRSLTRRATTIAAGVLLLALLLLHSCMTFRSSREDIEAFLASIPAEGALRTLREDDGRTIAWIEAGRTDGPLVIFVHGSPGSLDAFEGYLRDDELLERARLVSIDRPGFGHSGFGKTEPSLDRQAAAVVAVINDRPDISPAILVGHSYAGPVIARVAMDRPELVAALVLVAPSIDPDLEPKHWFQRPLASPFLRWLVPGALRASNEEILALEPQLRDMIPRWGEISAPVTIIQGGKDTLVSPGNADFARRVLTNAPLDVIFVDDMNHFVPWTHSELIRDAVLRHLDRSER